MKNLIAIWGDYGGGKSNYSKSLIIPQLTTVLGTGSRIREFLTLNWFSLSRHLLDNKKYAIHLTKSVTLSNIVQTIQGIYTPHVIIDEWSDFFYFSVFKSIDDIRRSAELIFLAIKENPKIEKVVIVTRNRVPWMPFKLYKKMSEWNKVLVKEVEVCIEIGFGKIIQIFKV